MSRSPQGGHPAKQPLDHLAPGAVRLGTDGKPEPQGIQMPARTKRTVQFQSCIAGIFAVLDKDNVCLHYKLVINDLIENVTYEYDFLTDVREAWETQLGSMPLIGEKPSGEALAADGA